MKKNILFLGLIMLGIVMSCKDDNKVTGLTVLPPNVNAVNPGVIIQSYGADLHAIVTFGEGNPVSAVKFELFDSAGTSVATKNFTAGDSGAFKAFDQNSITWALADNGTGGYAKGKYKMTVSATGSKGVDLARSTDVLIYSVPAACTEIGKITVILLSPDPSKSTSTVGFVGGPTGWGGSPGTDIVMSKIAPGVYCCAVAMSVNDIFKFRLDESWNNQGAKSATDCGDMDNITYTGGTTFFCNVSRWKPC